MNIEPLESKLRRIEEEARREEAEEDRQKSKEKAELKDKRTPTKRVKKRAPHIPNTDVRDDPYNFWTQHSYESPKKNRRTLIGSIAAIGSLALLAYSVIRFYSHEQSYQKPYAPSTMPTVLEKELVQMPTQMLTPEPTPIPMPILPRVFIEGGLLSSPKVIYSDGQGKRLLYRNTDVVSAALSPDMKRVAMFRGSESSNGSPDIIYVINTDATNLQEVLNIRTDIEKDNRCKSYPPLNDYVKWHDNDTLFFGKVAIFKNKYVGELMRKTHYLIDINENNMGYNLREYTTGNQRK